MWRYFSGTMSDFHHFLQKYPAALSKQCYYLPILFAASHTMLEYARILNSPTFKTSGNSLIDLSFSILWVSAVVWNVLRHQ